MCRRKRSRPSSKRRLTKKLKRFSSGRSVCASAMGVVDEQRLRTNGPALLADTAASPAPTRAASEAKLGVAVIKKLPRTETLNGHGLGGNGEFTRRDGSASVRASCAIVAAPPS